MRKILILMTCVLLTACVDDSASYYIDGADHSLSLRRRQPYIWDEQVALALSVSRWPDCVRLHRLTLLPASQVRLELFATGEQAWSLRHGAQIWQVESKTCNRLTVLDHMPEGGLGRRLGVFTVQDKKLVFRAEPASAAPAPGNPG